MRRRELITILGGAVVGWPFAARAQQKPLPVIGWLQPFSPPANLGDLVRGPAHRGLSDTGFVEGQNMVSEYRWAEGHYDRLPALAADLVSRKVDLIITAGGAPPALAAKMQPRQSRLSSSPSPTHSGPAWSPVSPGRAATSPASATSPSS